MENLLKCLVDVLCDLASLTEELFSAVYFFTEEALQLLLIFQSVTMFQTSEKYQSEISKIFDKITAENSKNLPRALIAFMEAKRYEWCVSLVLEVLLIGFLCSVKIQEQKRSILPAGLFLDSCRCWDRVLQKFLIRENIGTVSTLILF